MLRQILHVDMDAFFVSVEELENPALRGKAVVVGGNPNARGVVAAASYEARKFGVHSAQPLRTAKRLCPHAIFLRGHFQKYQEYSRTLRALFGEMTPDVEMVSVDEAYLDMTGCERLHGSLMAAAHHLIRRVKSQTGLNCSVGASSSHVVSKIASDQAKPHGLLYILPGYEAQFLAPLPIRRMPGIGKVTESRLRALGIETMRDLQQQSGGELRNRFGQFGDWLYLRSLGKDTGRHDDDGAPRSISHETTFDVDTRDREELERTLSYLAQLVGRRLREYRFFARTIGLKLRYSDFQTFTRDISLRQPTHLDSEIYASALRLFNATFDPSLKVRLLGVRASKLETAASQPGLWDAAQKARLGRLLEAADGVRQRFGFDAVRLAKSIDPGNKKK